MEPTTRLSSDFGAALELAFDLHRDHYRKGSGVPYVSHLLAVAALVLEDGGDEEEAIAALLHDALEDQPHRITTEQIRTRFGERVLDIVQACTDTEPNHAGGEKEAWLFRKRRYLRHVRDTHPARLRVSLADKVHNARSILADHARVGDAVFERFRAGKRDTLWYYRALVGAYRAAGAEGFLLDELDRTVREIERVAGHPEGIHEPLGEEAPPAAP